MLVNTNTSSSCTSADKQFLWKYACFFCFLHICLSATLPVALFNSQCDSFTRCIISLCFSCLVKWGLLICRDVGGKQLYAFLWHFLEFELLFFSPPTSILNVIWIGRAFFFKFIALKVPAILVQQKRQETQTIRQIDRWALKTCRQRQYQSLEWGWWPIPIQGHIKDCERCSTKRDAGGQEHGPRDLVISGLMWSTMESSHKSTMSLCDLQLEGFKPGAMWALWESCTVSKHSNMNRVTGFRTYTQTHTDTKFNKSSGCFFLCCFSLNYASISPFLITVLVWHLFSLIKTDP